MDWLCAKKLIYFFTFFFTVRHLARIFYTKQFVLYKIWFVCYDFYRNTNIVRKVTPSALLFQINLKKKQLLMTVCCLACWIWRKWEDVSSLIKRWRKSELSLRNICTYLQYAQENRLVHSKLKNTKNSNVFVTNSILLFLTSHTLPSPLNFPNITQD